MEENRPGDTDFSTAADVRRFGTAGDGKRDDTGALQRALDSGAADVHIPKGTYRVTRTLRVRSHTRIAAHPEARLFLCGDVPKHRDDFLLANADTAGGNCDISITGGIWDGNSAGKYNTKPDLFDQNGYSGSVLNFVNVRNLTLGNLIVANSVTYYIRMSRVDGFRIHHIGFFSERPAFNQDGLHFGGCVRNGEVSDIAALSDGQTNDDMIALNADDSVERVENLGLARGGIENITFDNITAKDCYTFIRLLSVDAPIRHILIRNVRGGCRTYAVNMDAARYCKTPLFRDGDRPEGVGKIEDVEISGMEVHFSRPGIRNPLILCESNAQGFRMSRFCRNMAADKSPEAPTVCVRNVPAMRVEVHGTNIAQTTGMGGCEIRPLPTGAVALLGDKTEEFRLDGPFSSLGLDRR